MVSSSHLLGDERDHEADEGECLDERGAQDEDGEQTTLDLRLTGHAGGSAVGGQTNAETSTDKGGYYLWADASAAAKTWGNKCSLPTKVQAQELRDSCTFSSESDGELGRFTGSNKNSVVLPAARFFYLTEYSGYAFDGTDQGAYWTSDADENDDTKAYELEFWPSGSWTGVQSSLRTDKCSVRPVLKVE